jgi:transcriptional regulator with XRE-family HTH domain
MSKTCHCCNGSGNRPDEKLIGRNMRRLRETFDISQKQMAKALRISAPFLAQLEKGQRHWTARMLKDYQEACKSA